MSAMSDSIPKRYQLRVTQRRRPAESYGFVARVGISDAHGRWYVPGFDSGKPRANSGRATLSGGRSVACRAR